MDICSNKGLYYIDGPLHNASLGTEICGSWDSAPLGHTADNIASELEKVTNRWHMKNETACVVTECAADMIAAARISGWPHLPCFCSYAERGSHR